MISIVFGATLASWLICVFILHTTEAQLEPNGPIHYSFASGRDVELVEKRYKRFQEAKRRGASLVDLENICGVVLPTSICAISIGRPPDLSTEQCDSACCQAGYKVGQCEGQFRLFGGSFGVSLGEVNRRQNVTTSGLSSECRCSNDKYDVKCGPAGDFGFGISCPFDQSACWRACCRDGYKDGKCEGFLRFNCKCTY